MFRRKPIPSQSGFIPPSPTSPPPLPPSDAPKPPIQGIDGNRTLLNSSSEWNVPDENDEEEGSDWWDRSDDEDEVQQNEQAAKTNSTSRSERLVEASQTKSPVRRREPALTSQSPQQDSGDQGIGSIPLNAGSPSHVSDKGQTNPFLRKMSQEPPPGDVENTSSVWRKGQVSDKPPQLSLTNFSREPLSPKLFHDIAGGRMAASSNAPQALHQTLSRKEISRQEQPDLISFDVVEPERNPRLRRASHKGADSDKEVVVQEEKIPATDAGPGLLMPSHQTLSSQQPLRPGRVPPLDVSSSQPGSRSEVETPQSTARRQRNESYQIKHIRWYDAKSRENPRSSPILIQNANGPCPLLALVNALVLTTPTDLIPPLIETLRTRENISLGLLLDAVFDELTSDRRAGGGNTLPDVGELYSFLITLHTGMNVNPRFVLKEDDPPTTQPRLGTFEETREMRFYSTFSVPLIHGWLPKVTDEAYSAFARLAPTYEDAQNMAFREAELEQKLQTEQFSDEEETLYMDLTSMKEFLTLWPTQLTEHGLNAINQNLAPGQVAILFRNDHFSTLYKEPHTGQLMTLVTDAGYSTHDEIVWESLADINGGGTELFSGDFRSVSHHVQTPTQQQPHDAIGGEWKTVENKNARSRKGAGKAPARASLSDASSSPAIQVPQPPAIASSSAAIAAPAPPFLATPTSPSTSETGPNLPPRPRTMSEQEDHDLALALQLQEEEEQAQRTATAARKREDQLSVQFLSREATRQGSPAGPERGQERPQERNQNQEQRPDIPPRRSNNSTPTTRAQNIPIPNNRTNAALTSHNDDDDLPGMDGDEAPPTYEAATAAAKANTLPSPSSNRTGPRPGFSPQSQSLYTQNQATIHNANAHLPGSRPGVAPQRRRLSSRGNIGRGGGGPGAATAGGAGRGAYGRGQGQQATVEEEKCRVM